MPFCTECGARHDEGATVCPKCGEPIAQPPPDEDLDDILASLGQDLEEHEGAEVAAPGAAAEADEESAEGPGPDYLDQIDEVRGAIAAQSSALQDLTDLTWANPQVAEIHEQLSAARDRLHALAPPEDLGEAHTQFLEGAELLVDGFKQLIDAADAADPRAAEEAAQNAIAGATDQFRRGADALHDYLEDEHADLDAELAALDLDKTPAAEEPLPNFEKPAEEEEEEELPELPSDLESLEVPEPTAEPTTPAPSFMAVAPPMPEPEPAPAPVYTPPAYEAPPLPPLEPGEGGAWPAIGDPATDRLLLEIEGRWVHGRPQVHDAIERAVRAAILDALRASYEARQRVETEARATLERLGGERNRLSDEVEALRREALSLQSELADMRRNLNELERERQIAQERRQQMFQEAEAQRSGLLREIEQLNSQLGTMRQSIVNLLNVSATTIGELPAAQAPAVEPPTPASTPAPEAAPEPEGPAEGGDEGTTEVRITGVASALKNVQLQRAIKGIGGVAIEGQPKLQDGVLRLTLRHPPGFDVGDALSGLPGATLRFEGMPEPQVLEFAAA